MKFPFLICGLVLSSFLMSACGGDEADIERAKFLLGRGNKAAATEAFNIVQPKLAGTTGAKKLELMRLYLGAQIQRAGFNGLRFISGSVYNDGQNAIGVFRAGIDVDSSSRGILSEAFNVVNDYVNNNPTDFLSSTDTRAQAGIRYQLGLLYFAQSLEVVFTATGLKATGSFSASDCSTAMAAASDLGTVATNLTSSQTELTTAIPNGAALNAQNPFVKIIGDLKTNVTGAQDITDGSKQAAFCTYVANNI